MHLLASYKSGALRGLPQILPPALYDAASRRGAGSRPTTSSGVQRGASPGGPPPVPAIPRQFSGAGPPRTQSPLSRPPYSAPPPTAQPNSNDWAVSPQEKAHFDNLYATLDKSNQGYINGDQAVGFFGNSRLPEEVLAQIWDLADINSEGRLNRDQFAVAMYLIKQQRGKRDGRGALPSTLPPNLIPPSMRQQNRPPPQPTAPTFDNAANVTQSKSAADDLFGLDAFSSPAPAQVPQSTGGSSYGRPYESSPTSPQVAQGASQHQSSSAFKPFVPSSSFGQNMMTSQATGGSSASSPGQHRGMQQSQPSAMDDLLGDNDPEISNKLTQETTELANLSNQVGSLSKQMQEVKSKRSTTETELSNASSQKRDFELRLSQLRAMYEQEVKDVKSLEDRLSTSRNETRRLQQEMAMIEGTHQDLQNQHRQVAGALEADQLENSNLKERMRQVNAEINNLKPQLEKLRSDARKQKGLVAINKKQLATNEGERERLKSEIDEQTRSNEEASRSIQSTPQVQSPTAMASPPASTPGQNTNPFFRRSATASSENAMSPQPSAREAAPAQQQNSFESVFGPSFASSPQTAGPPPTSFRRESQSRDLPTSSAQSGPSVRSSEGQDVPTPSTSPPPSSLHESPRSAEPPAPPESRQITSSFLPLRNNPERTDSLSSSVKVSAPASRFGGNDPGVETPTNYTGSYAPTPTHDQNTRKGLERTNTNTTETGGGAAHSSSLDRNPVSSPPATEVQKPGQKNTDQNDAYGFGQPLEQRDSIPGAFPETPGLFPRNSNAPSQPRSSGEGALDDRSKASSGPSEGFQSSRSDPFSLGKEPTRGPTAAKDDFDAAFAGIGDSRQPSERQKTGGSSTDGSVGTGSTGANKFHKEFPPIEEFGRDDESDSSSERGFDDNFTSASPQQRQSSVVRHQPQLSSSSRAESGFGEASKDTVPSRPTAPHIQSSASGQLPTASAQQSPPSYDQTVGSPAGPSGAHRDSNQFPAEYSGLLPSRQDPTSPTSPHGSNSPEKSFNPPMTGGQALFGGSNVSKGVSSNAPTAFSSSPPLSNTPLSTAPSDAYQSAISHPSGGKGPTPPVASQPSHPVKGVFDDDFDREFGDLVDAEEANEQGDDDFGVSHQHQEGYDEFNPVFDSPKPNNVASPQNTRSGNLHGDDSFNDFEHNVGNTTHAQPRDNPPPEISANSQDWDAIFAGLDSVHADIGENQTGFSQPNIPPKEPFSPITNSQQSQGPSPFQAPQNRDMTEGAASSSASKAPDLPKLGRALTGGTEHDDPILKRLTGMGYSRDASLNALEKFDYNIDKVSLPESDAHSTVLRLQC